MVTSENEDKFHGVGVIVIDQKRSGEILLVQENLSDYKSGKEVGMWSFPSGKLKDKEKEEDAVIREVEEETGYKVKVKQKLGVYEHKGFVGHAYLAEVVSEPILYFKLKKDIQEIGWFNAAEALNKNLRP